MFLPIPVQREFFLETVHFLLVMNSQGGYHSCQVSCDGATTIPTNRSLVWVSKLGIQQYKNKLHWHSICLATASALLYHALGTTKGHTLWFFSSFDHVSIRGCIKKVFRSHGCLLVLTKVDDSFLTLDPCESCGFL